jgi:hypothetical protein
MLFVMATETRQTEVHIETTSEQSKPGVNFDEYHKSRYGLANIQSSEPGSVGHRSREVWSMRERLSDTLIARLNYSGSKWKIL